MSSRASTQLNMRLTVKETDAATPESVQTIGDGGTTASLNSKHSPLICGAYRLRLAESREDLEAAFRLRFLVFNLELNGMRQTNHTVDNERV